jgi:thioredoxin-dependent peroxiredoxin
MRSITFKSNPLTLVGRLPEINGTAPDFKVTSRDLGEKTLGDFKGKIKIIASFPSLDTPVCDMQVREFNKRSVSFSPDIVVIGISKDLPFAQKRFCQEHDIKNIILSDYKDSSFGLSYGLIIKEWNLLARSVLIIDKNDILRYMQIVSELTNQPDYEDALKNLDRIIKEK